MPFKKGDKNINRKGRPRTGESLTEILRAVGEYQIDPNDKKSMTFKEAVALRWWKLAIKGKDIAAIVNLYRRLDGKEHETLTANVSGEMNVIIKKY